MNKKINLKKILKKHEKWLNGERGGIRANFSGMRLRGVDFSGMDLRYADFSYTDLRGADFGGADLKCACFGDADLDSANLSFANLNGANLSFASLNGANLFKASIKNICGNIMDLARATNIPYIPMACPDHGEYTAFKRVRNNFIVVLKIPEDAKRSSAVGRKCRADKAVVLGIESLDGKPAPIDEIESLRDQKFVYKVGETVSVPNFDPNRFRECAPGIHHFINRQEAVVYRP